MRIAVLSDIHGNIAALDAVLADIARRGADLIVNLGDSLSGSLFPAETADRLMALNVLSIRGNHDRQLLTLSPREMGAADRFAAERLTLKHRRWLGSLPQSMRLSSDVLLVHGTPARDHENFLETVTPEGMGPASIAEIQTRAGSTDAAIILCGHTHVERRVRLPNGRLVVNPGSVGLQAYLAEKPFPHRAEAGSPHARYSILHDENGHWNATPIEVGYDWESAARAAEAHGDPAAAIALRTGRAG